MYLKTIESNIRHVISVSIMIAWVDTVMRWWSLDNNGHHWESVPFQWRHNERRGVSNHRRLDGLLNRLLRRRSKKISKLRVTGLCARNSPVTGKFPSQRASNAKNASISWRHHACAMCSYSPSQFGSDNGLAPTSAGWWNWLWISLLTRFTNNHYMNVMTVDFYCCLY